MKDWADDGWNDYAAEYLDAEPSAKMLRLLKEAWLHGARTGLAKAQRTISEHRIGVESSENDS